MSDDSIELSDDSIKEEIDDVPLKEEESPLVVNEDEKGDSQKSEESFVVPKHDASFNAKLEENSSKRLDYLLKQTEIFAHFMTNGLTRGEDENKQRRGRPRKFNQNDVEELMNAQREAKTAFRFESTPDYIEGGSMREYQISGLNWMLNLMENGINGILADEMGLGKTLQTISVLGYMKNKKGITNPHIVIAPKSTLSNWMDEIKRWCPSLKALCLIGDAEQRRKILKTMNSKRFDVLVTSYNMILLEKGALKRVGWGYLVVDEAHRIKNEKSKLSLFLREFYTTHRLLLTGTPLSNSTHELWALLNFLLPDVFNSSEDFDSWFTNQDCLSNEALVKRLHSILTPFMLRRLKSEVERTLPPKKETKVFVELSRPLQLLWYAKILKKDYEILVRGKPTKARLLNLFMHLRKCANHPYLFEGAEPGPPYTTDFHLVENCGKMAELDKMLPQLKADGHRVLLFCQMTRMMDILEDYLMWRGYKYCRLDGNTSYEDREVSINAFNAPNSDIFIFMISTRAGGLGINLATADTVILYDSDWNPQSDLQAIDRAHRIGQTKPVNIYRLVTRGTVEEKVIECAEKKLKLDLEVIHKGRNMIYSDEMRLGKERLADMVEHGASEILKAAEENEPKEAETGRMGRRGKRKLPS